MSRRFLKLLGFLLLVAALSYVYVLNPGEIEVHFSRTSVWRAPAALILITIFSAGMLLTAIFALYLEAKLLYKHWRERKRFETIEKHQRQIVRVRELLASEQFDRASSTLFRMLEEDPSNIQARIMYADALCKTRQFNEALSVLDEGRTVSPGNSELLLLAANIALELGNHTAALDNVSLVLRDEPESPVALKLGKYCALYLQKFDVALDYQQRLMRVVGIDDNHELEEEFLKISLKKIEHELNSNPADLKEQVTSLAKRTKEFSPGWRRLAEIEQKEGNAEGAAKLYSRCFSIDRELNDLIAIAEIWLSAQDPSRAVAAVRASLPPGSLNTFEGVQGHLFLVKLLLHLEMIDEAKIELQKVSSAVVPGDALDRESFERTLAVLRSRILARKGNPTQALESLLEFEAKNESVSVFRGSAAPSFAERRAALQQPAPEFSTP